MYWRDTYYAAMINKFPYVQSAAQTHTLYQRPKKLKKEVNTLDILSKIPSTLSSKERLDIKCPSI
jgi:hypothetical protein